MSTTMIAIPHRPSSSGTHLETVAMLAVDTVWGCHRGIGSVLGRGRPDSSGKDVSKWLWLYETLFDVALPGLEVSNPTLRLLAGEL